MARGMERPIRRAGRSGGRVRRLWSWGIGAALGAALVNSAAAQTAYQYVGGNPSPSASGFNGLINCISGSSSGAYGSAYKIGTTTVDFQAAWLLLGNNVIQSFLTTITATLNSTTVTLFNGIPDDMTTSASQGNLFLPVHIAAGSMLQAQCASGGAGSKISVGIVGLPSTGLVAAYSAAELATDLAPASVNPANTITLNGTNFTPWQTVAASTAHLYSGIYVVTTSLGLNQSNGAKIVQIGWGASGSEQTIASILTYLPGGMRVYGPYGVNLPAGTRIAARGQAPSANTNAFGIYVVGLVQ